MSQIHETPPYKWTPGEGFDEAARSRLTLAFPCPDQLMGEAWFMSLQRKMYTNLSGDLSAIPIPDIMDALREITTGTSCFGPLPEWSQWFHYLLGRLIPRDHDHYVDTLLESLISAFVSQYPTGIENEPYSGFRTDALNTLGRSIMDSDRWADGKIVVGKILHRGPWPNGLWGWYDASGDFSASMFFCLKYLAANQIHSWLTSVVMIQCPHWRAQVIVWFVGAYPILSGAVLQPADLKENASPSIKWETSYSLDGKYTGDYSVEVEVESFLPEPNRIQALTTIRSSISEETIFDWQLSFSEFEYIENELGNIPERFCDIYLKDSQTLGT